MDMNNVNIEEIVKQVLSGMTGTCTGCSSSSGSCSSSSSDSWPGNPENSTELQCLQKRNTYEHQRISAIPEVGDDDILVKVEGCGVCGTDAHEFKR